MLGRVQRPHGLHTIVNVFRKVNLFFLDCSCDSFRVAILPDPPHRPHLAAALNQTTIRIKHCPGVGHFSDGKLGQISNGIYIVLFQLEGDDHRYNGRLGNLPYLLAKNLGQTPHIGHTWQRH